MNHELTERLKEVELLIDSAKFDEALEISNNIENETKLGEKDQIEIIILKLQALSFKGEFQKVIKLANEHLLKNNWLKHATKGQKLSQIDIIKLKLSVLIGLGKYIDSLEIIQKAEEILRELSPNELSVIKRIADIMIEKGRVYLYQGRPKLALELFQESLELYENIKDQRSISITHNILGLTFYYIGELDLASKHYTKCISICKEIGNINHMTNAYANLGDLFKLRGELDLALEHYLESIKKFEERGDKLNLSYLNRDLGTIYRFKGDYRNALMHYEKSLKLRIDLGNIERQSESLHSLIVLSFEHNFLEKANQYLQHLQTINEKEDNKLIDQRYRFGKALLLGNKKGVMNLVKAQKDLKQIANEDIIDSQLTIFALITLCKLLLKEAYFFSSETIIAELKLYVSKFFEIAKKQKSFILLSESYILQSRIAFMDQDIKKAKELLEQAALIAKDKKLDKITLNIALEQTLLIKRIETLEKYQLTDINLIDKIKITQLDDIVSRVIYTEVSKITKQRLELSEFTHQMAHDLKRNLTNVIGYAELIQKREYDKRLIQKIIKNALMMRDILTHSIMLADAGLVVDSVDDVDLNYLVESIAFMYIPPKVTLIHNELPVLICDRNKVIQIFKNLFENAIIHGHTTKTISVTRTDEKDGISLVVSNDGLPIPFNIQNRIFQPGFTTKKGNTGLGLAIVKKLIEAHGWRIFLDQGSFQTRFKIFIPIRLHIKQRLEVEAVY